MKRIKLIIALVLCGFSLLTVSSPSFAAISNNPLYASGNTWHFNIIPYLWATWMKGDITVNNRKSDVDITPKDIKDAADSAFAARFEVRRGRFGFVFDPLYMELSSTEKNIKIESTFALADISASYRFFSIPIGGFNGGNVLAILGVVGGRYWYLKTKLSSSLFPSVERSTSWTDPVVGISLRYYNGDKWLYVLSGDVGGFGVESDATWQLRLGSTYMFNQYFGLRWRLRLIALNRKKSHLAGQIKFKTNIRIYGPSLGFIVAF